MSPGGKSGDDQPVPAQSPGEGFGARHGGPEEAHDNSSIYDSLDRAKRLGSVKGVVGQPAPLRWFKARRLVALPKTRRPTIDLDALKLFLTLLALTAIMSLIARWIF